MKGDYVFGQDLNPGILSPESMLLTIEILSLAERNKIEKKVTQK